jgi:AGZA family xanthine/uracil permease-like MFS transporter
MNWKNTLFPAGAQPLWTSGDLDGFFGLALDNLIQYLLILGLGMAVLGFPMDLIVGRMLPGAALSLLVGNLFYAWQAQKLSAATGRRDVTALPYGINTVSMFAYVFLVMLPVKLAAAGQGHSPHDAAMLAWRIGLAACFVSGVIELSGSFIAERIRRATPRAALLSTLSGIAIAFISMDFAMKTFERPLVAFLPLAIILITYFGRVKLPFRIPGGAFAVAMGSLAAWLLHAIGEPSSPVSAGAVSSAMNTIGVYLPVPVFGDLWEGLTHPLTRDFFVPVMLPMGLFNVLGSLQNIESAEAAGDAYPTRPSLAVNGAGSMVAAVFGSCYPTTIYIGHPGWKALGARSGYSILNGVFFTVIALTGLSSLMASIIPVEAGMAIVLWIGIIITAQAFSAVPRIHAPAVAIGLFPAIAGFGVLVLTSTVTAAGFTAQDPGFAQKVLDNHAAFHGAGLHIFGLVAISQGFMLTCLVWSAMSVNLIERRFNAAAIWASVGAVAAFFGFIHAGFLTPSGGSYVIGWATGGPWAIGYVLCALFIFLIGLWARHSGQTEPPSPDGELSH